MKLSKDNLFHVHCTAYPQMRLHDHESTLQASVALSVSLSWSRDLFFAQEMDLSNINLSWDNEAQ